MRSITDALRERELQMEKLKGEIDALRQAMQILEQSDERPMAAMPAPPPSIAPAPAIAPPALISVAAGEAAKRWP